MPLNVTAPPGAVDGSYTLIDVMWVGAWGRSL